MRNEENICHDATCNNYFVVKCLLKSNVASVYLRTNCIEITQHNLIPNLLEENTRITNFTYICPKLYFY